MDKIQKALIKAGRKDLAQEYYLKVASSKISTSLSGHVKANQIASSIITMLRDGQPPGPDGEKWMHKIEEIGKEAKKLGLEKEVKELLQESSVVKRLKIKADKEDGSISSWDEYLAFIF